MIIRKQIQIFTAIKLLSVVGCQTCAFSRNDGDPESDGLEHSSHLTSRLLVWLSLNDDFKHSDCSSELLKSHPL